MFFSSLLTSKVHTLMRCTRQSDYSTTPLEEEW